MRVCNKLYDKTFSISKTIVLSTIDDAKELTQYLRSFNKQIDFFFTNDERSTNISLEKIRELPLSSVFISVDRNTKFDQFQRLGFTEFFIFLNGRLERIENIDQNCKKNIFKYTNRVTFELSNMCGYSYMHTKCPLNKEHEKKLLPSRVFYETIDCLQKYDYHGSISFHRYNEPLMDPRLTDFIKYARRKCPRSDIFILTNGFYLNQQLLDELIEAGVTHIDVTGYSKEEFHRLSLLQSSVPYKVFESIFDNRLELYSWPRVKNTPIPCYQPLSDLIITRDADVGLCHFDWKSIYSFGNLRRESLENIMSNSNIQKIYDQLTHGSRQYDICKKCTYATTTPELSFYYSNIFFAPQ